MAGSDEGEQVAHARGRDDVRCVSVRALPGHKRMEDDWRCVRMDVHDEIRIAALSALHAGVQ